MISHAETFEVITCPTGCSAFAVHLACATVGEHYARTTAAGAADDEVCATGLRVYEGAQVLAAFLSQYAGALVCPPERHDNAVTVREKATPSPPGAVVELGCGCGLAGFTASHVLPTHAVVFTDASTDCLRLVRQSGESSGMPVALKGEGAEAATSEEHFIARCTFPLAWSVAGVDALRACVLPAKGGAVDLVLGSDILYYRVDLSALLTTAKMLLLGGSSSETQRALCRLPLAVLSHYMRIVDGHRKLANAARAMGLAVARVPLYTTFTDDVVRSRGWGGLEIVVLCEDDAALRSVGVEGDLRDGADAAYVARLLEERSQQLIGEASKQAMALSESILPYLRSLAVTEPVTSGEELMGILL